MNQRDTAYLTMVSTTLEVLSNNETAWKDSPPATRQMAAIRAAYAAASDVQQNTGTVSTGVTDDKEAAAEAAIRLVLQLTGFVQAYAMENNNMTLYEQMKTSYTALDKLHDETLVQRLYDLEKRMAAIGEPVKEFGVTPERLKELHQKTDDFKNMKSAPRLVITQRKGHNQTLPELMRGLRNAFTILDKLLQGSEDHPVFIRDYFNARRVIDHSGRSSGGDKVKGDEPQA